MDGTANPTCEILVRHAAELVVFRFELKEFLEVIAVNNFVFAVEHGHKFVNGQITVVVQVVVQKRLAHKLPVFTELRANALV